MMKKSQIDAMVKLTLGGPFSEQVWDLHFVQGFPVDVIAVVTNIPECQVQKRIDIFNERLELVREVLDV